MKKITLLFLTVTLILFAAPLRAQMGMGRIEDINAMKERKMILLLQGYSDKVIEKLTKKGLTSQIPVYKKNVDEFNENLKAAVTASWKYHDEFEYMTYPEAAELEKAKNNEYAVIMIFNVQNKTEKWDDNKIVEISPNLDWNYKSVKKGSYDSGDADFYRKVSGIRVTLIEHLYLGKGTISMQGLSNVFPTKADIAEGLYATTFYIEKRLEGSGGFDLLKQMKIISPELKSKTLLIRASDLSPKLPKTMIKSHYAYKYQVVADSVLDNNIIDKTPGMAFMMTIPSISVGAPVTYVQIIMDCETGEWLGCIVPSIGTMIVSVNTGGMVRSGSSQIDDKVFEKLKEQMAK